ncbi:Sdh8p, partial [Ascoidea rubescens DSM 1968]
PPKLPKEDQEEFERLQKIATSQAAIEEYNLQLKDGTEKNPQEILANKIIPNDSIDLSTNLLKTIPEFEGDVNPKTGEIGGPKQDPLRHGDWSFNGRVTDF